MVFSSNVLADFLNNMSKLVIRKVLTKGDSLFHPDEQRELDLENDYPNKTGHNLKTNCLISVL